MSLPFPAHASQARQQLQTLLHVEPDGDLGQQSDAAYHHLGANDPTCFKDVQSLLHVAEDGIPGARTDAAYALLKSLPGDSLWPPDHDLGEVVVTLDTHCVKATSFADPADLRAFSRCKVQGNSDQACFAFGDNGIGKWGDNCAAGAGPKCALPPEVWIHFPHPRHAPILITNPANGLKIVALHDDTMPHIANIRNGARIDLSKDTCDALGIQVPADATVTWQLAPADSAEASSAEA